MNRKSREDEPKHIHDQQNTERNTSPAENTSEKDQPLEMVTDSLTISSSNLAAAIMEESLNKGEGFWFAGIGQVVPRRKPDEESQD